jgi:hypothetical protein
MAADGIVYAHMSGNSEETIYEDIRDYYTTSYRDTLPKKYGAELASASTLEEKKKYEAILASLAKNIDVDASFSAPRTYKGLDGVVAVIAGVSVFLPGEGYVEPRINVFFFRRESDTYKFVRTEPVGEDVSTYESVPVEMFKRDEAGAR